MQKRPGLPILIFSLLLGSCFDEGNCLISFTDLVIIKFKNQSDNSAATITMDSVTVDGISLLNYEAKELSTVNVPVNPHQLNSTIIFYYQLEADTLEIAYQRQSVILTSDCGANNYITDLSITSTDLENVSVVGTKLLKDVTSNVEIYF